MKKLKMEIGTGKKEVEWFEKPHRSITELTVDGLIDAVARMLIEEKNDNVGEGFLFEENGEERKDIAYICMKKTIEGDIVLVAKVLY